MSALSRSELQDLNRDQLVEIVLDLDRRMEDLEEFVEQEIETAGKDRARIRSEREDRVDDVLEEVADLADRLDRAERRLHQERAKVIRRVANIEDELGFDDEDVIALAEGGEDALRESPLSRLLEGGPEAVDERASETLYRAEVLARNWIRWGRSKQRGDRVIERTLATNRDDLRIRLEDARNEDLHWRQVYRAMKKVAELGPPNIRLEERGNSGKALVQNCRGGDRDR